MPRVSYEDLLNSATTVIAENEGFRKRIDELVGQERDLNGSQLAKAEAQLKAAQAGDDECILAWLRDT